MNEYIASYLVGDFNAGWVVCGDAKSSDRENPLVPNIKIDRYLYVINELKKIELQKNRLQCPCILFKYYNLYYM